jgi:hypothetical protein
LTEEIIGVIMFIIKHTNSIGIIGVKELTI